MLICAKMRETGLTGLEVYIIGNRNSWHRSSAS